MAKVAASHPGAPRLRGFAGILGGIALAWLAARAIRRRAGPAKADRHSAAFRDRETDAENFDQTRSAGPDAMRDGIRRPWEAIDQAIDESFPASDPPATYGSASATAAPERDRAQGPGGPRSNVDAR
ncbi:hypothetical protein [Sphingopyxis sp.]|uniref:hypothetical protein n=1 Tax=Sphingopyxis sp. TaxID=1908224 RepID=UPI0010F6E699|nr:hypothetical protein [Sphingopyxis sp.]MBR2171506.1 hypothetical protein [Sphingopyxis sp.]